MRPPEREGREAPKLFEPIAEQDGTFSVLLPSAVSRELEGTLGVLRQSFGSREEAEQAGTEAHDFLSRQYDLASLEKAYGDDLALIPTDRGGFVVLEDAPDGKRTGRIFESWQAARDHYLESRPDHAPADQLLELKPSAQVDVIFSELDSFHPEVAPTAEVFDLPDEVRDYLEARDKDARETDTYRHTIAEEGWERRLFGFVREYTRGEGAPLLEELGISRLDALTPEQAVQLSTKLTMELHTYSTDRRHEKETAADRGTALDFLKNGRRGRRDPAWKGNGVCRNTASTVKAVFEALKASQTKLSRLTNTYALFESGFENYVPKGRDHSTTALGRIGHAWNSFATISRGGEVSTTIVDATWGRVNLDSGKEMGADYTAARMETLTYALARGLTPESPDYEAQARTVMDFYSGRIEQPPGLPGSADVEEAKAYFARRVLSLIDRQGWQELASPGLTRQLTDVYGARIKHEDKSVIEKLWKLGRAHRDMPIRSMVRRFVRDKDPRSNDIHKLTVADDGLQSEIFAGLLAAQGPERFLASLEDAPGLRARFREVAPERLPEFRPETDAADRKELRSMAHDSQRLRTFAYGLDNPRQDPAAAVQKFFDRAYAALEKAQPERFAEIKRHHSRHQIIRRFDRLAQGQVAR